MHVILAGCGRVGSGLAVDLEAQGNTVVIIDKEPRAFRRLPPRFRGTSVTGLAFDRGTLLKAGVDQADAFVAVTNGDNSNIVAARIAREHYGIPRVVARIYDPDRARIYERHGITTIASARWTADAILGHLQGSHLRLETTIGPGDGDVVVLSHDLPADGGPWEVEAFARQGQWLPTAVTRVGQTTIPVPRQLVQGGERIHLAVQRAAVEDARAFLAGLGDGAAAVGRAANGARPTGDGPSRGRR